MIEIYAIVACFHFTDPGWSVADQCRVHPAYFRSFEDCERARTNGNFPDGLTAPNLIVKYTCMHKSVATWSD